MAKIARYSLGLALGLASFVLCSVGVFAQDADHLPSWNIGQAKQASIVFVDRVTKGGVANFVPEAQRVAVIDIPRQAADPGSWVSCIIPMPCANAFTTEIHKSESSTRLDEATAKGWTVVDMKKDWARIFPAR